MTDADWKESRMWKLAGCSQHFIYRAKKYFGNEYVVGNRLTKSNYDNTCYLQQIVRAGKSYRTKIVNEWWIDPDHVYFNVTDENGEYDMKVNMLW